MLQPVQLLQRCIAAGQQRRRHACKDLALLTRACLRCQLAHMHAAQTGVEAVNLNEFTLI